MNRSRRPEAEDRTTLAMHDHEREWLRRYQERRGLPSGNAAIHDLLERCAPDLQFMDE